MAEDVSGLGIEVPGNGQRSKPRAILVKFDQAEMEVADQKTANEGFSRGGNPLPSFEGPGYSSLSATMGSTLAARRAGM
jgi:hypothetical protein